MFLHGLRCIFWGHNISPCTSFIITICSLRCTVLILQFFSLSLVSSVCHSAYTVAAVPCNPTRACANTSLSTATACPPNAVPNQSYYCNGSVICMHTSWWPISSRKIASPLSTYLLPPDVVQTHNMPWPYLHYPLFPVKVVRPFSCYASAFHFSLTTCFPFFLIHFCPSPSPIFPPPHLHCYIPHWTVVVCY